MPEGRSLKIFLPTTKPVSPKKGVGGSSTIILSEDDKVISDQGEVCNLFNSFFVNVTKNIDEDCIKYNNNFSAHPSIQNNLNILILVMNLFLLNQWI